MVMYEKKLPLEGIGSFDRFYGEALRGLSHGKLDPSAYQIMTAAGSVNEGVVFVTNSGDGVIVTVPQAANAPGKFYIMNFTHANSCIIKDDASVPNTIFDGTAAKNLGVVIIVSTGNATLGTSGYLVFPMDDTN